MLGIMLLDYLSIFPVEKAVPTLISLKCDLNVINPLTISMLGKVFSRRHFEIFFLFFPENSF